LTGRADEYAPTVTSPSPRKGVFRWAWYHAREYRTRFWIGAVTFSALASGIGVAIVLPTDPTLGEKIAAALVALAIASALTVVGTYLWALVAAPYQQRDELGRLLDTSNASLAGLKAAPVTPVHAERLREMARSHLASIEANRKLSYGPDASVYRPAFNEHFPDAVMSLNIVAEANAARHALLNRLKNELRHRSMDIFPWNDDGCLKWLVCTLESRSLTNALGEHVEFGWQPIESKRHRIFQHISGIGEGEPSLIFILREGDNAEVPKFRTTFESLFYDAEAWPETAAFGPAWGKRISIEQSTVARLREIANMDPIRGACRLCSSDNQGS
jgi:hypothetical protein